STTIGFVPSVCKPSEFSWLIFPHLPFACLTTSSAEVNWKLRGWSKSQKLSIIAGLSLISIEFNG
ncbi:20979_t:CDS:2, partial [Racocetra persica]